MSLLVVVGMAREARIVRGRARAHIGGLGLNPTHPERPEGILSFGICGGLDPSLETGDVVIGERVVSRGPAGEERVFECDPRWRAMLGAVIPNARRTSVWADGGMSTSTEQKAELRRASGAGAVDMESHFAAAAAAELGLPFAVVRTVSDTAAAALPLAAQQGFGENGSIRPAAVLRVLLFSRPLDLVPLIATAMDARRAISALEAIAPAVFAVTL